MPPRKRIYRISFRNEGKVIEIYARLVRQGELYGFVEVEEILFGEKSALLVDPSEEQLKNEFAGVKRIHIPFHSVIRIDEVEKEGRGKIVALSGETEKVMPFPPPGAGPGKG